MRAIAGILLLVMILTSIVVGLQPDQTPLIMIWLGCLSGWIAALILLPDTKFNLRVQVSVILIIGLALIIFSSLQGAQFNALKILSANIGLLSMIAAIGYLRLVALPKIKTTDALPTGRAAFVKTLFGVSVFSSFINISAPLIISDRINDTKPLDRFTSKSIIRVFCSAASWSPFFGAMAVVLTYAPGSNLKWIILAGLPFSIISLLIVSLNGLLFNKTRLTNFVGFPMELSSLQIPALLVVCVIMGSMFYHSISVLTIITISALLVTTSILLFRENTPQAARVIKSFTLTDLPGMVNELVLFLAAGVLAAGIGGLVQIGIISNPFTTFGIEQALTVLGTMIVLSALGIHPIIQITSFTPLILPLDPNPNLLAIIYLFAWNLGTCSSPLSGTNLVFQGRYGIPSWQGAIANWPYAILMYGIAYIWLKIITPIFV